MEETWKRNDQREGGSREPTIEARDAEHSTCAETSRRQYGG